MRCLLLIALCAVLAAADLPVVTVSDAGVMVSVRRSGDRLLAEFVPQPGAWHLYSKDLPRSGVEGIGRPTLLELAPGGPLRATGPLTASAEAVLTPQPGGLPAMPIYPAGPVTLTLPVEQVAEADAVEVRLTWMACSDTSCLRPVEARPLLVPLRSGAASSGLVETTAEAQSHDLGLGDLPPAALPGLHRGPAGLDWYRVADLAGLAAAVRHELAQGRSLLLDFTGPSCLNCQVVAKSVMPQTEVRAALARLALVELDTDAHQALARWQQEVFGTQTRPMFVRLDALDRATVWADNLRPGDRGAVAAFTAFLTGGGGRAVGDLGGWGSLILLAVLGGLFTLVMPCTYPMVPFTINFFVKQSEGGRRLLPLALAYGLGITAFFVLLGVVLSALLGSSPQAVAGSPWTNLAIGAVFVVLGLSLLGALHVELPAGLQNLAGSRAGYLGALAMGATFALAAFTCTAPFAGAVLAQAANGAWFAATVGMAVYGGVLAAPFVLLGLAPGLLRRLPRAGAWMQEFKVVAGLVEVAAALKFLAIADAVWDWGLLRRDGVLALWSVLAALAGAYLLGWWRTAGDERVEHAGAGRLLIAVLLLAAALLLASGLAGNHLGGVIEGFFPADAAPPLAGG